MTHSPRPLVLVPTHPSLSPGSAEAPSVPVQALNQAYLDALTAGGASPLLIPCSGPLPGPLDFAAGLLLPGGADLAPARYGQELQGSVEVDEQRDELELELLEWALAKGLPVLAICRGLQVLNVARGGTLIQDLPTQRPSPAHDRPGAARSALVHDLSVDPKSRLGEVTGRTELRVNSLHHQCIDRLGEGLVATAWSDDGLIEAAEMPDQWVVGVQFHPEELLEVDPLATRLFSAFVNACQEAGARS